MARDSARATSGPPACGCLSRSHPGPREWGLAPVRTERPSDAREAADALAACARAGETVWPVGTATRLAAVPPVPDQAVVLQTSGLSGIVALEAADLTITLRGGTLIEHVHAALEEKGIELPAGHFGLAGGTIGGAIATDLADARRGAFGPLRDRILGRELAAADGRVSRSGGRVVKNVTGYDVGRLFAGSCGSLGVMTEVTLRLAPRPETHAPFERGYVDPVAAVDEGLRIAREAPALGMVAVVTSGRMSRLLWVHEGDREWVEAGAAWTTSVFGAARDSDSAEHSVPVVGRLLLNALEHVCPERSNLLVRGSVRPGHLPGVIGRLREIGLGFFGAYLSQGTVFARAAAGDPRLLGAIEAIEAAGGTWRVQGTWRETDGPGDMPWGGIETPWALYARIKQAFDPALVLGPRIFARGARGARGGARRRTGFREGRVSGTNVLDRAGPERADLLRCVHCGLCLSACPTYRVTRLETESPRGRIYLMRALSEGRIEPSREMSRHLDLCLNCRACETACPAGVHYGLLLETTRARLALELPPTIGERVRNLALEHVFPFPDRLALVLGATRVAARLGLLRLVRGPLGRFVPAFVRAGAAIWPEEERSGEPGGEAAAGPGTGAAGAPCAPVEPGIYLPYDGRPARARVGWFRTCLMPGMFPAADRAAVHLLREAGATVVIPERQTCCGSLHAHSGLREGARELARTNLAVFEEAGTLDWIATDAAGCGATLREYGDLFRGGPAADARHRAHAEAFAARVRDVTEVLVELGLPAARAEVRERIAVHDACHLAHAQKVRSAPRVLLRGLPGAEVVDLAHSDRCCGSAGIYNLTKPEMATELLTQKMDTVAEAHPTIVSVSNPGCLLQMRWGARARGIEAPMLHPVEIIARAYPRHGAAADAEPDPEAEVHA